MTAVLQGLRVPIVQAPMAGGPSTPELAAAVSNAGGLGFLAAGYKTVDAVRREIAKVRHATSNAFGVNLFVPQADAADASQLDAYIARIRDQAQAYGVAAGDARWSDDDWEQKLEVVAEVRPPVVSFTFGSPHSAVVHKLRAAGVEVWVTVTEPDEAQLAATAGADALIVQGVEAGAHRGSFVDADGTGELGLLPLLRLVARVTELPLVASGGLADGYSIAAVLVAGAVAAQLGTAFLATPEAGTSRAHRARLRQSGETRLTRAFTGRRARAIVNEFLERNHEAAPSAYPHVYHLTAPLRAAARERDDFETMNLWAGQGYPLLEQDVDAAVLVAKLHQQMEQAIDRACHK